MFTLLSQTLKSFWYNGKKSSKFFPLLAIAITVILILLFKLAQPEPPVKTKDEKSWLVQTHQLVEGAKTPQLELYGQVESPHTSTITASVNADVMTLDAKEGEKVSKGQLLIKLDEADVLLTREHRAADVAEMEAMVDLEKNRHKSNLAALKLEKSLVALAKKKLSREEKTSKTNLTSQSSFDTQKQALHNQELALEARQLTVTNYPATLAQLEAKLANKRALLTQAETDLKRTTIIAPFDGVILTTAVSPGERVRPGEELLKLYSIENVEVRAQLPQKFVNTIKDALNNDARLNGRIKAYNGDIDIELNRLSGAIANTGIGIDALFEVDNKDVSRLVMGEVFEVVLDLPAIENVYSVPVAAIYGTNRVYRVVEGRLQVLNIDKVGTQIRQGKQFILIRSDKLNVGDEIITTQLPHAVSGLKVEVRNMPVSDARSPSVINSDS